MKKTLALLLSLALLISLTPAALAEAVLPPPQEIIEVQEVAEEVVPEVVDEEPEAEVVVPEDVSAPVVVPEDKPAPAPVEVVEVVEEPVVVVEVEPAPAPAPVVEPSVDEVVSGTTAGGEVSNALTDAPLVEVYEIVIPSDQVKAAKELSLKDGSLEITPDVIAATYDGEPTFKLEWKVPTNSVVTVVPDHVENKAMLYPIKAGSSYVTITVNNSKSIKLLVTVIDDTIPKSVKINDDDGRIYYKDNDTTKYVDLADGNKMQLSLVFDPEDAVSGASWKSSNTSVATVNSSTGLVALKKVGTTTIRGTASRGGKYAEMAITVEDSRIPTGVKIYNSTNDKAITTLTIDLADTESAPNPASLYSVISSIGENDLNEVVRVKWSTSNSSVVSISPDGSNVDLTGKKEGTATITVTTAVGNKTAKVAVTVINSQKLKTVTVWLGDGDEHVKGSAKRDLSLSELTDFYFTAKSIADDEIDGLTAVWSSSKTSVATVGKTTGHVVLRKAGTTVITAKVTSKGVTVSGSFTLTVVDDTIPTSLYFNEGSLEMFVKDTYTITAQHNDKAKAKLTWKSSKTTVATVKSNGTWTAVITAKKAGKTTITVKATPSGKTASIVVNVSK